MAAVIGRETVMQSAQKTFISSTYWTDRVGPTAALATIRKHRKENVPAHLKHLGERVQKIWTEAGSTHAIPVDVGGLFPLSHFSFQLGEASQAAHTYFTQLMLERGFLATKAFYATFAHTDAHIDKYRIAVNEAFGVIAEALRRNDLHGRLNGPVAHSGFYRLT